MRKLSFLFAVFALATLLMMSCKKDYQSITTEFISNLPDTCEILVQVENGTEHFVYYKGKSCNSFYCYNAETDKVEVINCPDMKERSLTPLYIGAGNENIMIGYMEDEHQLETSVYTNACVQRYNLKTRSFKEFTTCNGITFDYGKNQLLCETYDTNRYGEGTRIDELYDFDGKLLSKKEVEVGAFD